MSLSKSNRRKTSKAPPKSGCAHSPGASGQENTRFEPRRASGPGIERQGLVEKCTSAAPGGMILIEAPAGYGKTILLYQWFRKCRKAGHPIAYISGRETGNDDRAFLSLLLQAIASAADVNCKAVAGVSSEELLGLPFENLLGDVLRKSERPWTLLIDDYERAQSDSTDTAIQVLLDHIPDKAAVGLATQRRFSPSLTRWILEGRLTKLGKELLKLSRDELRALFGGHLTPAELQRLLGFTEGWPAAARLAQICSEEWRGDPDALVTFAQYHRLLKDFCASEILAQLDADDASFLVDCSVLDEIEPAVCDAIRQADDSFVRLSRLAKRETFIEQLDAKAGTFEVPKALRHALRGIAAERHNPKVEVLFERAAEAFAARGNTLQAVRNFVAAGLSSRAAHAFESAGPMEIAACMGDLNAEAIFELLPDHAVCSLPRLALCRAYLDYKKGLLESARYNLEGLSVRTEEFTVDRDGGNDARLRAEALIAMTVFNYYRSSSISADCLRQVEGWIPEITNAAPRLAPMAHEVVGVYCSTRGDFDDAESHFVEAEKLAAGQPGSWVDLWLKYHRAALALAHGRLMQAKRYLQTAVKLWKNEFVGYARFGAAATVLLAELDYESDDLEGARAKLDEARDLTINIEGWHEHYAIELELTMMSLLHRERAEEADLLLEQAAKIVRVREALGGFVELLRFRLFLLQEKELPSNLLRDVERLSERWMSDGARDEFSWRSWVLAGLCLSHFYIRQALYSDAIAVLDQMEQVSRRQRMTRVLVKVALLRAAVILNSSPGEAVITASQALELSITYGYKRAILDECWGVRPVLSRIAAEENPAIPERVRGFAATLAGEMSPDTRMASDESGGLSKREIDVISELSLGFSNKLIGRNLTLSEPTVKFHLQNIFRKLGVHKRAAAIAEARRRRLIE